MKKIYSIGRDPGCDIYLYDDKNVISRNHAVLKIGKGGKYFITDQSMNGTYINGIKVTPGVLVPVTRKDVISFAHMAELDWSLVPDTNVRLLKIILISVIAILFLGGTAYGGYKYIESIRVPSQSPVVNPVPAESKETEEEKNKRLAEEREAWAKKQKEKIEREKKAEKAKKEVKEEPVKETKEEDNVNPII